MMSPIGKIGQNISSIGISANGYNALSKKGSENSNNSQSGFTASSTGGSAGNDWSSSKVQKGLQVAASMGTAMGNSVVFESWGHRLMNHTITHPEIPFSSAVTTVKHEFTTNWPRAIQVIRASAVEAVVHRGIVKYGPFWMVREQFQEWFPEDTVVDKAMNVAGPTAILTVGEMALVTPFTRGYYHVLNPKIPYNYIGEAMRGIAKEEGFRRGLWSGSAALGFRTLAFTGGQNLGITAVETARSRLTPDFSLENPLRAKAEKSLFGTVLGVWFSMGPQLVMTRVSGIAGSTSKQVFLDMIKNPRQMLVECSGSAFLSKLAFKGPNCVAMMMIPGLIVNQVNQSLLKE